MAAGFDEPQAEAGTGLTDVSGEETATVTDGVGYWYDPFAAHRVGVIE
jgi:hypothetical protein